MERDTRSKATFVVEVQLCENSSWQGTVRWVEYKKEQRFRSTLELLKLMDEVLTAEQGGGNFIFWN